MKAHEKVISVIAHSAIWIFISLVLITATWPWTAPCTGVFLWVLTLALFADSFRIDKANRLEIERLQKLLGDNERLDGEHLKNALSFAGFRTEVLEVREQDGETWIKCPIHGNWVKETEFYLGTLSARKRVGNPRTLTPGESEPHARTGGEEHV